MNCKYTCLKCKHYFEKEAPGPGSVTCPKCGHLYVDWINYKSFCLKDGKEKQIKNTQYKDLEQTMKEKDQQIGILREQVFIAFKQRDETGEEIAALKAELTVLRAKEDIAHNANGTMKDNWRGGN